MDKLQAVRLTRKFWVDIYLNGYTEKQQSKYYPLIRDMYASYPRCEYQKLKIVPDKKLPDGCEYCILGNEGVNCKDFYLWKKGDSQGEKNIINKCISRELELLKGGDLNNNLEKWLRSVIKYGVRVEDAMRALSEYLKE